MSQISSLSELLALSGSQYRVYDIGRKIEKLSKDNFLKIEQASQPYPSPFQGHAHLAVAFWQQQNSEPYLWFIKLPLDERGLLNLGARNHFIAIIIEALGKDLTVNPSEQQEELLKSNPYHFTPAQYKLAALNSILKAELKQSASSYYEHCQLYLSGKLGWQEWQNIGIQGLCDIAARISLVENYQLVINALEYLPEQVLSPLATALENQELPYQLSQAIINQLDTLEPAANTYLPLIRALASSCQQPVVSEFFDKLLAKDDISVELLITISGRCWPYLAKLENIHHFMELLAQNCSLDIFAAIFQDLVAIPAIRTLLMTVIRSPERSEKLSEAIGMLFEQVKS
jgi:hypothetical protein